MSDAWRGGGASAFEAASGLRCRGRPGRHDSPRPRGGQAARTQWESLDSRLDAPEGLQITMFEELASGAANGD